MKPKQLCYWSDVSSSPYKAVGSLILVGFIFTSEFSRVVVKVKTELLWRNNSYSESYPYHFCVVEGIFQRGPLNTSHLQAVLLQYLLKYEKLFPCYLLPGSPPRVTHWTTQRLSCTCVWSRTHWTAVLGSWTKGNFQHLHKGYFEHSAKDLGDLFFKETNTLSFQS